MWKIFSSSGIPMHCGRPMEYMGKVKIKRKWYSQYRCLSCSKLKNVKD